MLNKDVNDKSIKEEGERMVPAFHKGALVFGEHLVRYESIEPLIKDKVVLDIASGSGYGTYLMAGTAKKVIGVEIDKDSVEYAKKNYAKDNVEYLVGAAEKIPLKDGSVDVVVTFETIEHVKDYHKFLAEIKRVLSPGGVAVISTPNDPEFAEDNKFHLHEFNYQEIKSTVSSLFKHSYFMYQHSWLFSALMDGGRANKEWRAKFDIENYAPVPPERAIYFLTVCSDQPLDKLPKPLELGAIAERYSHREARKLFHEKEQLKEHIKELDKAIERQHQELESIYNSRGWKMLSATYTARKKAKRVFRQK